MTHREVVLCVVGIAALWYVIGVLSAIIWAGVHLYEFD